MPSASFPVPPAGEAYPRPTGEAAQALVWAQWPSLSDSHFDDLIAEQQRCSDLCREHRDATLHDRDTQSSLLVGKAGDANRELLLKLAVHADEGKTHFDSKVTAAKAYKDIVTGVKIDLTRIADAAQQDWEAAKKTPGGLGVLMAAYAPEVETVINGALLDLAEVPQPTPLPEPPTGTGNGVQALDNKTENKSDQTDERGEPTDPNADDRGPDADASEAASDGGGTATDSAGSATDPTQATEEGANGGQDSTAVDAPTPVTVPPGMQTGQTTGPGQPMTPLPSVPSSPLGGGGGGSGSGGSGLGGLSPGSGSSLASAFKSAASPSLPSASAGTSPASAVPKMAAPPDSFMSGLSNAGSSFQSGVASGMGASGAVSPTSQYAQPLAPMPSHTPVVAAPTTVSGPLGTGGAGAISAPDGPVGSPGGHGGPGGGPAAAPMGGGGIVPPPAAAAGQPLGPYSPPAAGAQAPPAGTAATAGGSAPQASSSSASAGSPAVVAGNTSASAATSALAASTTDVNPDVAMARRVLAGLVRGSQPSGDVLQSPVSWAVAVLRTPTGAQTVVASSMGGGGYVPVTVYLPVTARLAVFDSALPIGWASEWMGWQQPTAILAAHFERLSGVLAGVKVSAIVTSEVWPKRPDCGGDFVAVRQTDILQGPEQAPMLDAGHQHRLAATDVGLTSRLASLARSFTPDIAQRASAELAARLTDAVLRAAAEPDETGQRLCGPGEEKLWQAIRSGSVKESDWTEWAGGLDTALQVPEIHAPRDQGPSEESMSARMWYRHYYRAGRVAELLACWDSRRPSSGVWDVAYCGVAAGFGGAVASVITDMEQLVMRARQS